MSPLSFLRRLFTALLFNLMFVLIVFGAAFGMEASRCPFRFLDVAASALHDVPILMYLFPVSSLFVISAAVLVAFTADPVRTRKAALQVAAISAMLAVVAAMFAPSIL